MNTKRVTAGGAAAVGLAAAIAIIPATAASAHVTATPTATAAGAYTIVTVSVPHGCDDSSTTAVAIDIPEGVNAVTPTVLAGWSVEKVMEQLPEPITDAHGNELTERVGEVVYAATDAPLPGDMRAAFELSLQLPADAAGETLYFPTVQTCEQGEAAWIEIPAAGEDGHDLAMPAPSVTVTAAASEDAHAHSDETDAEDETADSSASGEDAVSTSAATSADATGVWLGAGGLVAGLAGLVMGGVALARSRSKA